MKHFLFFHLQNDPPLTELDPALQTSAQPDDLLVTPPDDFLIDPLMEPAGSQSESKAASEVMSEPSDFEDLTNNLIDSPLESGEKAAIEEFVDILGSETAEEEVATTVAAASDQREVPGAATDQSEEAPPAAVADPLIDILTEAPPADVKRSSAQVPVDLFDDDGSDLFAEPRPNKTVAQQATSLFDDPDEDLFGEPLGADTKKPSAKQQQSKPEGGATVAVAGPLQDAIHKEPADIFSEEAVTMAPSSRDAATAVKSKTNGLHSEEESDIFAGRHATRWQGFHLGSSFSEESGEAKGASKAMIGSHLSVKVATTQQPQHFLVRLERWQMHFCSGQTQQCQLCL